MFELSCLLRSEQITLSMTDSFYTEGTREIINGAILLMIYLLFFEEVPVS